MKFYDSNENSSLTFCYSVAIYVVQWEIYGNSSLFLLLFSPYLVCRNIELWCCFSNISSKFSWSLRNRMQCRHPCVVFMFSLDILSPAIWARFTSAVVILSSSLLSYKFFFVYKNNLNELHLSKRIGYNARGDELPAPGLARGTEF